MRTHIHILSQTLCVNIVDKVRVMRSGVLLRNVILLSVPNLQFLISSSLLSTAILHPTTGNRPIYKLKKLGL